MQSAQFQLHAQIEETHWWFVARRRILRALVHQVLPPDKATTVVDVGCGTGANLAALADDYRCVGIDTSQEAIDLAKSRFPGVHFVTGYAPRDLGATVEEARLFLLMDVLEHVPDDRGMLSEILAAASPGAHFLITVPADMALWSGHDEAFGHYRRYTRADFARLWADLAVETRLLSYFNARLYPLVRLVRTFNRRWQKTGGRAGTDFSLPARPLNWLLEGLFAGEQRRLQGILHGGRQPFRRGVSLIALLQRRSERRNGLPQDGHRQELAFTAGTGGE